MVQFNDSTSRNRDICFLTDYSQLTLAQTSASTLPSNTQSYLNAHLAFSTLQHLSLHCSYTYVSLHQISFFLSRFTFLFPQVLSACLKMFFKCSGAQVSCCMSLIVWPKPDSFQSSFSERKCLQLLLNKTSVLMCPTELKRVWFYSLCQLQDVLKCTLPFTKSDLHILWCSCFPQDCIDKRHLLVQHTPREKCLFPSCLFLVVVN